MVAKFFGSIIFIILFITYTPAQTPKTIAKNTPVAEIGSNPGKNVAIKNSWQGITPLRSTTTDVAKLLGYNTDLPEGSLIGPYRVEDGEVSFSYLSPSLAKLYRAPASMTNKVFAIYIKPAATIYRSDLKLGGFKECREDGIKGTYYMVNDAGLAYQFKSGADTVERIVYQPSRVEVRRLAVNTECVF